VLSQGGSDDAEPAADALEGVSVSDIVDNDKCISSSEVD
jgi:hypothetical protein